ncbi:MAG: transglutaminase-like cysteine peptidase [Proteobacteria bacterium]|nr:transglutaminase-like cysteine peptidase [Pseudomonadota bacterium]
MVINVSRMRAVSWAFVCAQIVAGTISAKAEPARVRAPLAMAAAQPLQFFTIADRLAALRAAGRLKAPAGTAVQSAAAEEELPRAASVGLRLASPDAMPDTLLGTLPFAVPGGDLARKWQGVQAHWRNDEVRIAACDGQLCRNKSIQRWLEIRAGARELDPQAQLLYVQRRMNASIRYDTDARIFGMADYWASPLEVVMKAGDCEDFAIAKYMMLRQLGFATSRMKIVALRDHASGEFHAVLAVRHEDTWVFLDNRIADLSHESDYTDTTPLAMVDDDGQSALVRMNVPPALRLSML